MNATQKNEPRLTAAAIARTRVDCLRQLALGLEESLLERAHPLRRVLDATEQGGHLALELGHPVAEVGDLVATRLAKLVADRIA